MKQIKKLITLISFFIIASSCSYDKISEKIIPSEESQFAKEYISKLKEKEFEYIKSLMSPEVLSQVDDELLLNMANYFRSGEPISTEIIGSHVNIVNGQWYGNFTFEYKFETGLNIANAALKKIDGGYEVIGLNVYQTEQSQKELNSFSLVKKSALHYVVFTLAILIPLFIAATLIVCIKTPIRRRKWLWIIFILLGFGSIQINWTSGEYAIQLLTVYLFGASAIAYGIHAPWIISASVPIGAIIFWIKRKNIISQASNY